MTLVISPIDGSLYRVSRNAETGRVEKVKLPVSEFNENLKKQVDAMNAQSPGAQGSRSFVIPEAGESQWTMSNNLKEIWSPQEWANMVELNHGRLRSGDADLIYGYDGKDDAVYDILTVDSANTDYAAGAGDGARFANDISLLRESTSSVDPSTGRPYTNERKSEDINRETGEFLNPLQQLQGGDINEKENGIIKDIIYLIGGLGDKAQNSSNKEIKNLIRIALQGNYLDSPQEKENFIKRLTDHDYGKKDKEIDKSIKEAVDEYNTQHGDNKINYEKPKTNPEVANILARDGVPDRLAALAEHRNVTPEEIVAFLHTQDPKKVEEFVEAALRIEAHEDGSFPAKAENDPYVLPLPGGYPAYAYDTHNPPRYNEAPRSITGLSLYVDRVFQSGSLVGYPTSKFPTGR